MSGISLSGFRISEGAGSLDLRLKPNDFIGLVAPAELDPSRALRELASKAPRGARVFWIARDSVPGRSTVQQLTKPVGSDRATQLLTLMRLWDVRRKTIASLPPAQALAAALVGALCSEADAILSDETLDGLDPWTLPAATQALADQEAPTVVVTRRPDVLEACRRVVVLHDKGVRFDGAPADLVRILRPATVEIETEDPGAVSAMIEPLRLQVQSSPGKLVIHTTEGQKLAAELCLRGYGQIRAITVRTPTFTEALRELIP